jgi:hypothetical protein
MNFSIRHRIEKLEAIDMRLAKRIVWEDGSGSAEREIARLDAVGNIPLYTAIGLVAISLAARAEDLSTATAALPPGTFTTSAHSDEWKIANALSAGPTTITEHATVVDWPANPKDGMSESICIDEKRHVA